MFQSRLTS